MERKNIKWRCLYICFPQYNWGYPAALKNAIDHLYHEWGNKPALTVSYANRGGGKAAAQLKQVLQGVHMNVAMNNIEIKLSEIDFSTNLGDNTYPQDLANYSNHLMAAMSEIIELHSKA